MCAKPCFNIYYVLRCIVCVCHVHSCLHICVCTCDVHVAWLCCRNSIFRLFLKILCSTCHTAPLPAVASSAGTSVWLSSVSLPHLVSGGTSVWLSSVSPSLPHLVSGCSQSMGKDLYSVLAVLKLYQSRDYCDVGTSMNPVTYLCVARVEVSVWCSTTQSLSWELKQVFYSWFC